MAKCPKCKTEVAKPEKTWKLKGALKKSVTIGLYYCSKCKKKFQGRATK